MLGQDKIQCKIDGRVPPKFAGKISDYYLNKGGSLTKALPWNSRNVPISLRHPLAEDNFRDEGGRLVFGTVEALRKRADEVSHLLSEVKTSVYGAGTGRLGKYHEKTALAIIEALFSLYPGKEISLSMKDTERIWDAYSSQNCQVDVCEPKTGEILVSLLLAERSVGEALGFESFAFLPYSAFKGNTEAALKSFITSYE